MNEKKLIRIMREEYVNRLLQLEIAAKIAETKLVDDRGNILIAKDLKVKHEESGYEYTVADIQGAGDDMVIYLRKPEMPRIDPPPVTKRMNELDDAPIVPIENIPAEMTVDLEKQETEGIFAVSAQDFEKEYIID